jgi:hypothetical protein
MSKNSISGCVFGGREERLRFAKLCTAGILENCRQKEIMQNFTNYVGATNGRTGLKEHDDLYCITLMDDD